MPGRRLWFLAAALASILPLSAQTSGPAGAEAVPARPTLPTGLEGESFSTEKGGRVIVARKARFVSGDAELGADSIRMDLEAGTIVAEGNVTYSAPRLRIFGEKATVDTRAGTLVAERVRVGRLPTYFFAERFVLSKGDYRMEEVGMWRNEPSEAGISLRAGSGTYTKRDERIVLKDTQPRVGGVPFLHLPHYSQRGYRDFPADLYLRFRDSSPQGAYIRTMTTVRQSATTWTGLLLDLHSKAGVLAGPSLRYDNWNLPDAGMRWRTNLVAGLIRDESDLASRPDPYGRVVDRDRFFVLAQANGRSQDGFELAAQLQGLSDPDVVRDYRGKFARDSQLPQTFVELTQPVGPGYASLLASMRTDDFQDVVQRLPEARLDLPETPLPGSGVMARGWLSAARLVERSSEQLGGLDFLDTTGFADRAEVTRVDGYLGLGKSIRHSDWMSFRPVLGARSTWWDDGAAGEPVARVLGQAGFDLEMTASATWDAASPHWAIDGLRHTVRPFLGWRALPELDAGGGQPRLDRGSLIELNLPVLDLADRRDNDTVGERQVAQLGVRNTLETRDPAKGTREVLRADVFLDWRDPRGAGEAETAAHAHLAWTAADWLSVHTLVRQPTDGGDSGLASWAEIRSGDLWQASLGYTELTDPDAVRQAFLNWTLRLNSAFRFKLGSIYDLEGGAVLETNAVLVQRIGDSWELEYGVNERSSRYDDGSLGFTVRVRVFKF